MGDKTVGWIVACKRTFSKVCSVYDNNFVKDMRLGSLVEIGRLELDRVSLYVY